MNGTLVRYAVFVIFLSVVLFTALPSAPRAQTHRPLKSAKPDQPATYYIQEGKQQFQNKRFAFAIRSLSAAIRKDPTAAEAYLIRGRAHEHMGLAKRAEADFTRYILLRPRDPAGYIARADLKNFSGRHDASLEDYNKAVRIAPASTSAYTGRGLAYAALEKYDLAIKDYQWVLRSDPTNHEALGNMGVACMMAGRPLEAMSYFERALKNENDPEWRGRIEKWVAKLLEEAASTPRIQGPRRGPQAGKPARRPEAISPWKLP